MLALEETMMENPAPSTGVSIHSKWKEISFLILWLVNSSCWGKMAFILRVFDGLVEDEDENLAGFMKKLYGPLLQISMVFASRTRPDFAKTLTLGIVYTILFISHILILANTTWLLLLEDEFDKAGLAFHYMLIIVCSCYCFVAFNIYYRENIATEHITFVSDIGQYCSGRIYDSKRCVENEKTLDRETLMYMTVPAMVCVVASLILGVPYTSKWIQGRGAQYTSNGVNLNLPIAAYYPYPTDTGILHFVTVGCQLMVALVTGLVIVTCVLIAVRVSQRLRYEYKVLQYSMESLFARADKLYELKYQRRRKSNMKTTDPRYQRIIGMCLRDSVIHHHKVVELANAFTGTMAWPIAVAYSIGTCVIGLSLLSVMSGLESGKLEDVLLFSLLCLCEVLNIFVVSLIGESLTSESAALRDHVYHASQWYKLDARNRKILLNFQVGVNEPFVIHAVLVDINMETFSSIMNSAYSFFNLMNA